MNLDVGVFLSDSIVLGMWSNFFCFHCGIVDWPSTLDTNSFLYFIDGFI